MTETKEKLGVSTPPDATYLICPWLGENQLPAKPDAQDGHFNGGHLTRIRAQTPVEAAKRYNDMRNIFKSNKEACRVLVERHGLVDGRVRVLFSGRFDVAEDGTCTEVK